MPSYKSANPRKKIPSNTLGEIIEKSQQLGFKPWVNACIVILWAYGIRIGELAALRRYDIQIKEGFLILESIPLKNPSDPFRDLPLSTDTPFFNILIDYIETLGPNDKIMPMSDETLRRRLKAIDPELSPHVFRHWRGTRLGFEIGRAHV